MNMFKHIKDAVKGLATIALAVLALTADAQTPMATVTNLVIPSPLVLTNAQSITNNSTAIALFRGRGIAFGASCTSTDNCAGTVTLTFQQSIDGTFWSTTPNPTLVLTPGNTASTIVVTNFPESVLGNVAYVRLFKTVNTHTNSLTVSNLYYSIFP